MNVVMKGLMKLFVDSDAQPMARQVSRMLAIIVAYAQGKRFINLGVTCTMCGQDLTQEGKFASMHYRGEVICHDCTLVMMDVLGSERTEHIHVEKMLKAEKMKAKEETKITNKVSIDLVDLLNQVRETSNRDSWYRAIEKEKTTVDNYSLLLGSLVWSDFRGRCSLLDSLDLWSGNTMEVMASRYLDGLIGQAEMEYWLWRHHFPFKEGETYGHNQIRDWLTQYGGQRWADVVNLYSAIKVESEKAPS